MEIDNSPETKTVDDQTLIRSSSLDLGTGTPPRRSMSPIYIVIALVGVLIGGYAAWRWAGRSMAPPRETAAARPATEGVVPSAPEEARPLPPIGEMDTFLRALLGALSSRPELARWLATDDLIHQMADALDRSARGQSPARNLGVLKPDGSFRVLSRRGGTTLDPASYHRYDGLAAVVASLDANAVASAYRTIYPRLDQAYRDLGRTEGSVDRAVELTLETLLATPVVRDPVALVPGKGTGYAYADPRLEALKPLQKQLLRMGPDNVVRVQSRLREIADAIRQRATRPL